jgi:hypothetical protein
MARRGQRLEEQLAGAAGESPRARAPKRRGRFVKVIVLGGVVAVVVKPQVRNRLLDALFGPEEQFDYESLTEPAAPGIHPDDGAPGWPSPAAAQDEDDDGPSWTLTNETDWGAAIAPLATSQAQADEEWDAALDGEEEQTLADETDQAPPTAFGVSSLQDVEPPAHGDAAPYEESSADDEPPAPQAFAPSYEAPAHAPPTDEVPATPASEPPPYEPPASAVYEPLATDAYEPPPYEPPASAAYEPPVYPPPTDERPAYEPPATPAYEPPPYESPATPAYESPADESPASTAHESAAHESPAYESPAYEPPAHESPAPVDDDLDRQPAADSQPVGDREDDDPDPQPATGSQTLDGHDGDGTRDYAWGVPASESPVRPPVAASDDSSGGEPAEGSPVEASWEPATEPVNDEDREEQISHSDSAAERQAPLDAEEDSASAAGEQDSPLTAAEAAGAPEPAEEESPAEDPDAVEPAIGEAGPPPRGGWWLSRRRRGQSAAPEPPRWD